MVQQPITDDNVKPISHYALEEGPELDAILEAGYPIFLNGVEVDRYYPLQQKPIDWDNVSDSAKRVLALAGAWSDLDWEDTEASLERIDRESQPTPPIEFDW